MYCKHFDLREPPFGLTPDTSFFFNSSSYQEALNVLLVAVRNGEGFIKITGEVGNGKTLLCRKFLATLNQGAESITPIGTQDTNADVVPGQRYRTAYIANPYIEPRTLLMALADEFRVPYDENVDQHQLLKGLTIALLNYARNGQHALVCLDEAQALPLQTLEVLRLLTNLETEKRKLLQVVLFGQPELDAHLAQYSIRQLRQRISFQYDLKGLRFDELERYVRHRLRVACYKGEALFEKSAFAKLHRVTKGTPRLVNIVAHKALMLAFGEGVYHVSAKHIAKAASDTPEACRDWQPWWVALGVIVLLLMLVIVFWMIK